MSDTPVPLLDVNNFALWSMERQNVVVKQGMSSQLIWKLARYKLWEFHEISEHISVLSFMLQSLLVIYKLIPDLSDNFI